MQAATVPPARIGRKQGRRGSKRAKLTIDETTIVKAPGVPVGARFKGYEEFVVQDLVVQTRTTRYRGERWLLPSGKTIVAPLPGGVTSHFGPGLKRFVLAQYQQGQTTMPRLLTLLHGLGIDISKRQLVRLHNADQEAFTEERRVGKEATRARIWQLYADLKAYALAPTPAAKTELSQRFDAIFTTSTCFALLNRQLARLHTKKAKLLAVLERPDVVLHTNGSENDIRAHVTRRKVSGGTRSDTGRDFRDAFLGLMKTLPEAGDPLLGLSGQPPRRSRRASGAQPARAHPRRTALITRHPRHAAPAIAETGRPGARPFAPVTAGSVKSLILLV